MDSDMHVIEPIDLWQTYMDPAFRDRAPKGVTRFQGDMMMEVSGKNVPYWMPSKRYFDWQKQTAEDQGRCLQILLRAALELGYPGPGHGH